MQRSPRTQKGMTLIGWVIVIMFAVTMFTMMIRLVPAYLESFSVKGSLESLAEEPNIDKMSLYKMKDTLSRRFYVNDVKSVDAKTLEVSREGGKVQFNIQYEVRVHGIGNMDMVLKFDKKVSTE
jgi:Domain of unknown function (DUF4845)